MNGHPQFDEDFELYALGALEGEERQELESHLRECSTCREKLERARGVVSVLALAAPQEQSPLGVRDELLRRIGRERVGRLEPWRTRPWVAWALAAAAVVLAVASMALKVENSRLNDHLMDLNTRLDQQRARTARARAVLDVLTAPDTLKVTLLPASAHPAPQGKAFYEPRKGLLFYAANLPRLSPNQTYQLWLVPAEGNPISAGIFNTDAQGNGQVLLPALPSGVAAKAFAVTIEPSGGVPQPTGPKVLIGLTS